MIYKIIPNKALFYTIILSCVFSLLAVNPPETQTLSDGPYIFYQDGMTISRSLDFKEDKAILDTLNSKKNYKISCSFINKRFDLPIKLKDKITVPAAEHLTAEKIFVISDIEGEFSAFRDLLLTAGVIDSSYNWQFGKGHLVLCGDAFDRGDLVTEVLWLLYTLEDKATAQGGQVHYILGNHDIMNLTGDFRYVNPKYLQTAKQFNLEYATLYSANTEFGRWLRSKNVIEKINDNIFVHGGISAQVNNLPFSISQINDSVRFYLNRNEKPKKGEGLNKVLFSENSPFWFRGYFKEENCAELLKSTRQKFDIKQVFVGHTIVDSIQVLHDNGVIGVDTPHAEGISEGVLIDKNRWTVINKKCKKRILKNL